VPGSPRSSRRARSSWSISGRGPRFRPSTTSRSAGSSYTIRRSRLSGSTRRKRRCSAGCWPRGSMWPPARSPSCSPLRGVLEVRAARRALRRSRGRRGGRGTSGLVGRPLHGDGV